jgi:AcrR family transcriptional regulator
MGSERSSVSSNRGETRVGRPRDERLDEAICDAALELIAGHGIADLRMDAVAKKAGVGKAAIYRRFRSKDELVTAVVSQVVGGEIVIVDTGSTAADLRVLMDEACALYRDTLAGPLMPSLVEAMHRDPELRRLIRERFLTGRRAALAEVLRRGVQRGDLDAQIDIELALDVLGGPLFYRLLITGGPLDDRVAAGVVDLILNGYAAAPKSRAGKRATKPSMKGGRT